MRSGKLLRISFEAADAGAAEETVARALVVDRLAAPLAAEGERVGPDELTGAAGEEREPRARAGARGARPRSHAGAPPQWPFRNASVVSWASAIACRGLPLTMCAEAPLAE